MEPPDTFRARRNRALVFWSLALSALCFVAGYFWYLGKVVPETAPPAVVTPPPPRPEVKLNAKVTDCNEISARVDFVGGYMVNVGENYRQMNGIVTNTGDITVRLVEVNTLWRNEAGKTVQMGTVYVATDTPLAPGEQVEFSDSTQNYLAVKCAARIGDWWVAPEKAPRAEGGS